MHPHQSAGTAGGAKCHLLAFQDDRLQAALRQVEGNARSYHPRSDDDRIEILCHILSLKIIGCGNISGAKYTIGKYLDLIKNIPAFL